MQIRYPGHRWPLSLRCLSLTQASQPNAVAFSSRMRLYAASSGL